MGWCAHTKLQKGVFYPELQTAKLLELGLFDAADPNLDWEAFHPTDLIWKPSNCLHYNWGGLHGCCPVNIALMILASLGKVSGIELSRFPLPRELSLGMIRLVAEHMRRFRPQEHAIFEEFIGFAEFALSLHPECENSFCKKYEEASSSDTLREWEQILERANRIREATQVY